jgi:hypothetical protein
VAEPTEIGIKELQQLFFDERLSWQSYKIIFNEPDPAGSNEPDPAGSNEPDPAGSR